MFRVIQSFSGLWLFFGSFASIGEIFDVGLVLGTPSRHLQEVEHDEEEENHEADDGAEHEEVGEDVVLAAEGTHLRQVQVLLVVDQVGPIVILDRENVCLSRLQRPVDPPVQLNEVF